ncbi:MAG: hypothetical protein J6O50_13610 [Ruminiclostridium sp.]|nr:hypothetical protein [Ruminiclostridium sp.]
MTEKDIIELDKETERRISEMESGGYEFPERFLKRDYIIAACAGIICLALVIAGAFL